MDMPNLAIVAGTGDLPKLLADHCDRIGRGYHIVQFEGVELNWAGGKSVIPAKFEKPDKLFKSLKKAECGQVVFAGAMQRPKLNPLKFDFKLMKPAPTLLPALKKGDNGTLSLIAKIFEAEGFKVVAAHDILNNLLGDIGPIGFIDPSNDDLADIQRGLKILAAMSSVDVGQACIVGQGICLGVETIQGSDAMLRYVAETKSNFLPDVDGAQGVFIKSFKLGQDKRMDMPTIGPKTIQNVADAGLAGLAVLADGVQVLHLDECIELADGLGIFLTVVDR